MFQVLPWFRNCDEEVHELLHVEVAVVVAVSQTEDSARHVATGYDLLGEMEEDIGIMGIVTR